MDRTTWDSLERVVKDQLASKYGVSRSGVNNEQVSNEELAKIPDETKKVTPPADEKPKKKIRKVFAAKATKRSNGRRATK